MSQLVILGTEAVRALSDADHSRHRRVVSHLQIVASRKGRSEAVQVVVPTVVRVEAGWDRTSAAWAFANRLRIGEVPLDQAHGDAAAAIRRTVAISAADAHLGAVSQLSSAARVTVVTGDPEAMRLIAADRSITIVAM